MKEARLGRWHISAAAKQGSVLSAVEMKEARLGRWHPIDVNLIILCLLSVEMKEARLGRWHTSTLMFSSGSKSW